MASYGDLIPLNRAHGSIFAKVSLQKIIKTESISGWTSMISSVVCWLFRSSIGSLTVKANEWDFPG